jgi:hypothetical protein
MKGFLLGLVVAALGFGGYVVWKERQASQKVAATPVAPDAGAPVGAKRKKRRSRGAARVAVNHASGAAAAAADRGASAAPEADDPPEPERVHLTAADLRIVGQGDDLNRPDVVRMDLGDGRTGRELTQDDIDARFRPEEGAILDCISNARPDPETYVPGRVTVKFRIQRDGHVRGLRVEAPAILQKGGLTSCVRNVVGKLRFPTSDGSQVVTYPYSLS